MDKIFLEETLHPPLTEYKLFEFHNEKKKIEVNVPLLTADEVEKTKERIRSNRNYLAKKHTKEIIEVLSQANEKWLDRDYHLRNKALEILPIVTEFSPQMVEHTLDEMLRTLSYDGLSRMFQIELGHPFIFDQFVQIPGLKGLIRGYLIDGGPKVITISNAGNVHALSMLGINRWTPLKVGTLNKVASEEPSFLILYKDSIKEIDRSIADCIEIVYWEGENREVRKKAFNTDGVEVYGGPKAIHDIQETIKEIEKETGRNIPGNYYGHKVGLGYIGKEFLRNEEIARSKARDVGRSASLYKQQGCLSVQEIAVEEGGVIPPIKFAEFVNEEMEKVNAEMSIGKFSRKTVEEISYKRANLEFDSEMGEDVKVFYSEKPEWTIVYDGRNIEFEPCENIWIRIKQVKNKDAFIKRISPMKQYLQTLGLEVPKQKELTYADALGRIGVTRICKIASMGYPKIGPHDGRFPIRTLIEPYIERYTVIEK